MIDPASIAIEKLHDFLGSHIVSIDRTRFCVWAPMHARVFVELPEQGRRTRMHRSDSGYHVVEIDGVEAGDCYRFIFGGDVESSQSGLPDPASRFQPQGVHGPSMVIDSVFEWTDQAWRGVRQEDLVVYEVHVGTFSEGGTFLAAIDRLDELVELGVTAIELMPVADSAGRWNWGYDGVNLFAPNRNYGIPSDFRRLVNAAHSKGLAVFLDVVYNHLGPEGNYLAECGPYLSSHHTTVWGAAPNFDDPEQGPQLRRFFVANAIHWLDEYHLDGLRIDAIHCMKDESERHVVAELSEGVRQWSRQSGRQALLIAESNVYDPNMLSPLKEDGMGFDAEWCDDFLHSVFAVARPGEQLCHRQYRSGDDLDQTLRFGYVYEGTLREQRGRKSLTERVVTSGLVYAIQHHDFIGNHPLGKRLHQVTSLDFQRAAAALMMLSPAIPMIFMGEEFACERPFQFFVDFSDEHLRQAVVEGRRREYPQHDWSGGTLPVDSQAFYDSKIGASQDGNREMRDWYQELLQLRRTWRSVGLLRDENLSVYSDGDTGCYGMRYEHDGHMVTVAVRLSQLGREVSSVDLTERLPIGDPGKLLLDSHSGDSAEHQLRDNHAKVFLEGSLK